MVAWYANSSAAFSGKRDTRTAAIKEKRSTHCEILVIAGRGGAGVRPDGMSSMVSSAISMNSKSRIRFTVLAGKDAAGLNGPLA